MPAKKTKSLDEWSAEHFSGRVLRTDTAHAKAVLEASGRGKRRARVGLPPEFPQMRLDADGLANQSDILLAAEKAFASGYSYALIVAFECLQLSSAPVAFPPWMLTAMTNAITLWQYGHAKSLDDALGLKLPRSKAEARNFRLFHHSIYLDVVAADKANVAIDNDLFDEIGKHYGNVSSSKIARIYADVTEEIKRVSENT